MVDALIIWSSQIWLTIKALICGQLSLRPSTDNAPVNMKGLFTSVIVAAAAQLASAHYTFPYLIANGVTTGEYQYVRITANHWVSCHNTAGYSFVPDKSIQSNGPVTNVKDASIRCYELDTTSAGATSTATVSAGSTVGFKADNTMGHPGYFSAYMTPASPAANSNSAGLGSTWFKIWEWAPTYSKTAGLTFDSMGTKSALRRM
jgi:hypothetical protein